MAKARARASLKLPRVCTCTQALERAGGGGAESLCRVSRARA